VIILRARPGRERIAAVHARRDAAELVLRLLQFAHRNRQQPIGIKGQALVEPKFLLEPIAAKSK